MLPSDTHPVPLLPLTEETAAPFGELIDNIADAEIELVPWRVHGSRAVTSGGFGDVIEGQFHCFWRGEMMFGRNHAVGREDLLGWRVDPTVASEDGEPADRSLLLVDEVNYHDDGGQAFWSPGEPTVFLLAPPGDDVRPDDFVALYTDGRAGVNTNPGVWHTAPLPISESVTYLTKQGSIHATVGLWAREEFGILLEVPLRAPMMS